jgi:hypothetical protein
VQTGDIGVINTPADFKALYIDINKDSAVVFDFTDPKNPIYY